MTFGFIMWLIWRLSQGGEYTDGFLVWLLGTLLRTYEIGNICQ